MSKTSQVHNMYELCFQVGKDMHGLVVRGLMVLGDGLD